MANSFIGPWNNNFIHKFAINARTITSRNFRDLSQSPRLTKTQCCVIRIQSIEFVNEEFRRSTYDLVGIVDRRLVQVGSHSKKQRVARLSEDHITAVVTAARIPKSVASGHVCRVNVPAHGLSLSF